MTKNKYKWRIYKEDQAFSLQLLKIESKAYTLCGLVGDLWDRLANTKSSLSRTSNKLRRNSNKFLRGNQDTHGMTKKQAKSIYSDRK